MNIDALETLAKDATPGPWSQAHRETGVGAWNTEVFCPRGESIARLSWYPKPMGQGVTATYRADNAAYIAAASPDAVLKLIRVARAVQNALSPSQMDSDAHWNVELREALAALTKETP